MLIGICPKCCDYKPLVVKELSNRHVATLCTDCDETIPNFSGFEKYLMTHASNYADNNQQCLLNQLKIEARKALNNGFITKVALLQIERVFVTQQPI